MVLQSLLDGSRQTVFLTPTRQSLGELLDALKVRGGIEVVLLETVGADDRGALTGLSPAKVIFASVRERLIQQRKMKTPEHRFPTPLGTRWEHVTIRFITQQQVDIRARGQSGVYEFTQVGMADMRSKKEPKPDVQWQLLIDFAENGGELTWRDSQADRRNAKRKELLAKGLKKFFGIEDEPFKPLPNGTGWRARFTLIPEVDRPERNFAANTRKNLQAARSRQKIM